MPSSMRSTSSLFSAVSGMPTCVVACHVDESSPSGQPERRGDYLVFNPRRSACLLPTCLILPVDATRAVSSSYLPVRSGSAGHVSNRHVSEKVIDRTPRTLLPVDLLTSATGIRSLFSRTVVTPRLNTRSCNFSATSRTSA